MLASAIQPIQGQAWAPVALMELGLVWGIITQCKGRAAYIRNTFGWSFLNKLYSGFFFFFPTKGIIYWKYFYCLLKKKIQPKAKHFCDCIQVWFAYLFETVEVLFLRGGREKGLEKKHWGKKKHPKTGGCKVSYGLMTAGFNPETWDKSRKAMKSEQERYGILQRSP